MKDLSNYILSILDDNIKLETVYKVWYEEGTYMIEIYLKDIMYINDTVQKHIEVAVGEVLDTYFPKGSIQYKINIFYYLT